MKVNWAFVALRFREAGTWRALGLFLFSAGIQIPTPVWNHIVLTGSAFAGLVSIFIPELGSPVTTDVGQARIDAGLPLTNGDHHEN